MAFTHRANAGTRSGAGDRPRVGLVLRASPELHDQDRPATYRTYVEAGSERSRLPALRREDDNLWTRSLIGFKSTALTHINAAHGQTYPSKRQPRPNFTNWLSNGTHSPPRILQLSHRPL